MRRRYSKGQDMKLPEAFEQRMIGMLGEDEYRLYLECFEKKTSAGLRVNRLKLNADRFKEISGFHLKTVPWIDNGFYYEFDDAPSKHPFYYAGLYYLQEPSAMTPANLLPIREGDCVLDLCAAPGGKSTEIASKLNGTGILVANDISATRAKALLKNLEVFGARNILVTSESSETLAKRFPTFFDKILVDAPCSGEGMFRKQPEIMKNWEQYGTQYYNNLQKEILPQAIAMLKPGGYLLYSTCTFAPLEDEETIQYVLEQFPEMELASVIPEDKKAEYESYGFMTGRPDWMQRPLPEVTKCARLFPHKLEGEGHFVALLRKKDDAIRNTVPLFTGFVNPAKLPTELREFIDSLKQSRGMKINEKRIMINEERVYAIPENMPDIKGIRVLRSGWYLGDAKKGRFEPSQACAMGLYAEDYPKVYNMDVNSPDVIRYLKCETLEVPESVPDGQVLICADGFPLGFAKIKGSSFKNRYLPGWRMM